MASENPNPTPKSPTTQIHPNIDTSPTPLPSSSSNPNQPSSSSSSSVHPNIDTNDVSENLSPDSPHNPSESHEQLLLHVPGAILHLIDKNYSIQLAIGDFSILQLRQSDSIIAILARVTDIQWPLARHEACCVKLDQSHYFFSLRAPKENNEKETTMLNYGITFASKGQEKLLKEMDELLEHYSSFSKQKVEEKKGALDVTMVEKLSPLDLKMVGKMEEMEKNCSAYWTTLAPNVEDYSSTAGKLIAAGSGQLVKGILWCGDVTVDRLLKGNEILKIKIGPGTNTAVSPELLKSIQRVKKVTIMTETVVGGILSGVLKITGFFTSSVANSKLGKKFFKFVPGEIALATLDGFSKICDAFEVSGKNVMTTSSTVTTELVNHKYGEEAAKATNEGMDAAGHAVGAAWTVFKIRTAMNPRGVVAPSVLTKTGLKDATEDMRNQALKEIAKDSQKKSKKTSK